MTVGAASTRRDNYRRHLQRTLASGVVFQGVKADVEDQDVCVDQREGGPDSGLDDADRNAGAEVPAVEIDVLGVTIESGCAAAATNVLLPGPLGGLDNPFQAPPALAGLH